ncbi:MAG TPA: hypothetical protein VLW85_15080 [Myxococcales bacterium]|nr:hypothetical protein [Myxococcales bacterium]
MRFLSIAGILSIVALGCGSNPPVCTAATQAADCATKTPATPVCLEAAAGSNAANKCVACIANADCNSFNKVCTTNACVAKAPTFTQPSGTTEVDFSVDDTANKVFTDSTLSDGGVGPSDLQWKGAMLYDPATNSVTADATWGGPWAPLYDDGPWDQGGHEPKGATAGDHVFGVAIFAPNSTVSGGDVYSYGLNDNLYQTNFGNGWIWPAGPNGSFTVPLGGSATAVKADGLALKKFGTTDLQLTIDTSNLIAGTWDTSVVQVKGAAWAWGLTATSQSGTKYTFTLSGVVGSGKPFPHTGLVNSGDKPEFIFTFGPGTNPKEYKTTGTNAAIQGVTAAVKASGASSFTPVTTIGVHCNSGSDADTNCTDSATGGNGNSFITVP